MTKNVGRQRTSIVSRIYSPEPSAASFRLKAVATALAESGTDVQVLTTLPAGKSCYPPNSEQQSERIRVKRWPVLRDKAGYVRGYLPYLSFDIPLFFRLLLGDRSDVVLVEPPPTTGVVTRLATAIRRIPYVWYAADVWSDATKIAGAPGVVVAAVRAMERFAVRGAAGSIAVSEGVAQRVRALGGRNVVVVPNGIDTDIYRPDVPKLSAAELEARGISGPYALYAGTASEWQGAKVFAEAMDIVAETDRSSQLVFVGQGSEWEKLEQLSEQLRLRHGRDVVVLLPPTDPASVARLLVGAEVALVSIVPGKGYDFAYPTKVLAALASGVPAIYAGAGPLAEEMQASGLGWVTDHNPNAVAQALSTAFEAGRRGEPDLHLRDHVEAKRSLATTGKRVAQFVRSLARTPS